MICLDLFSAIGCHALGFERAGIQTIALCEIVPARRAILAKQFPGITIHDDVRTIPAICADIAFGGPPCQATSVAAAIHGKRTGESLWPYMLDAAELCHWVIVEQPAGNKAWEAKVAADLQASGRYTARIEFAAGDLGAPYQRRRVYVLASPSLPRLEIAWRSVPFEIECVARAANARGSWNADKLGALRVDAQSSGEMDRGRSIGRKARIEALGDSNPPEMAEVIGRAIMRAFELTPSNLNPSPQGSPA
jgi:site-specific DNA-cytosine methylase